MRFQGRALIVALLILIMGIVPLSTLRAQDSNTITLQVAVPSITKDAYSDKLLAEFEAANPGVKVKVVAVDTSIAPSAAGLSTYFDNIQKYVSSADVLYVDSTKISVEATMAGYYLDLSPLVNEDKTLNTDDFYPKLWQSFQWNKGVWALPVSASVYFMSYIPAEFDKVGLAYPNDQWTIDDVVNAVNKLAQKDTNGNVTVHGIDLFGNYSKALLFRSMAKEGLYDDSVVPNNPSLDQPDVEDLMTKWVKLEQDGYVGTDLNVAPLSVSPATTVLFQLDATKKRVPLLLPGGQGGVDVQGFAVSKGTQYQEKAYALAAFLTTKAEAISLLASAPARKSLNGAQGNIGGFQLNTTPEFKALIAQAIDNAIPLSEMRDVDFLALALNEMLPNKNPDAKTSLQDVENTLVANFKTALTQKDTNEKTALVVATPVPDFNSSTGKIALHFGVTAFQRPLANQDKWDSLIADFTANDPQVGKINLDTGFDQISGAADKYDCFYQTANGVPNAPLNKILNLDPFLGNDPSFDKSDVVGNVLTQVSRDNKIWALPINIQPSILKYDADKFSKAGAQTPTDDWTIAQFNDAVKVLKTDPKADPPFIPAGMGGTHLIILIAAYGGLPLDYRTDPPTINFTDPTNVTAIRQVLDLAKNGYIKYSALGSLGFGLGGASPTGTIYTSSLNGFTFGRPAPTTNASNTYIPTNYPRGTQFSAVSYSIGTAYISATTQNPDACYRWISTLAKHPEIFNAMPVRNSLNSDPTITAAQGPQLTALYTQIAKELADPNTISVPAQAMGGGGSPTAFLLQYFMYKAFDAYVLQDKDLESALKDAEDNSKAFQACAVNLPPYDASTADSAKQYIKAFGDCATKVDPTLKPLFALIGG